MSERKYYQLGTHTEEQWDELHHELIHDGSHCDEIPERCVECADDKFHSKTRGTYLLDSEEAKKLKNDPRVKFLNIDYSKYEEFKPPKDELQSIRPELVSRYSGTIKNYREFEVSNTLAVSPDATDSNRASYSLYRHQQFLDPWVDNGLTDNAVPQEVISQYGSGKDIDVIVADEGCWIGHPEFQNNCVLISDGTTPVEKPAGYVGGNLLPGNGTCDVLDVVLDGPYHIDPDWFDADPGTRLTTRWDGTTVPVESVARDWWGNAGARSAKFANEGTVSVSASYTRTNVSGDNTSQPTNGDGEHGTPCGALTYGRTQGWAYNANKWMIDLYGFNGSGIEEGFDIQKLFHRLKPINTKYGVRNPTISSNSWGYRSDKTPSAVNANVGNASTLYYNHRATTNVSYTTETGIAWLSHMGTQGDNGRWKSEMKTNSLTTALDEMIEEGVIFVGAAGNSNQKVVKSGHPDFDNYITTTNGGTLEDSELFEFGVAVYGTTNRTGFPQQGGMYTKEDGSIDYKTINIGALDDDYNTGLEAKVGYSDRGEQIDVYAAGDGTLAANKTYTNEGQYPATYSGLTFNGGTAYDCAFGGTSAACPVAAGFLATILEHNRDWTWRELKDWVLNLNAQNGSDFYLGTESTTPNDANWTDYESIEGGAARVLYQAPIDARFKTGQRRISSRLTVRNSFNLRVKKY
jgi:hypothetical protein